MAKRKRAPIDAMVLGFMKEMMDTSVMRNAGMKHHTCLCGCGMVIKNPRSKYHQFYDKSHYQRAHRIPGYVRRIINHKD